MHSAGYSMNLDLVWIPLVFQAQSHTIFDITIFNI